MLTEIREWLPQDSYEKLTELLHASYGPRLKSGHHFFAATQTEVDTRERVGRARATYLGVKDGSMVATISLYKSVPTHSCEHYRLSWYFGQFAVRPDMQRAGIGSHLIDIVEHRAAHEGAERIALDTAETAYDLIHYYQKRGYAFVRFQQWPDVKHRSVILSKEL